MPECVGMNLTNDLTTKESQVLKMLAGSLTNQQIRSALRMSPGSLHVHCCRIRQKTGITDTRDWRQCKKFLEMQKPKTCVPTPRQMDVLRLLAQGKTHKYIAASLGMSISASMNYASQGMLRMGIHVRGERRMATVRALIASIDNADVYDPMSEDIFN